MRKKTDPRTHATPDEDRVRAFLMQFGLESEKVPEAPGDGERRCDIRAWADHELHWIEVKSRMDNDALSEELRLKEVVLSKRSIAYAARVAEIFDDAVKQLDTLAAKEDGFEILWLFVRSHPADTEAHREQAIATAFGTEDILDLCAPDEKQRPCYFFSESAFFKHKQLDAVVIFDLGLVLCVNPLARRAARFRETRFFDLFRSLAKKYGAASIIDPAQEEKAGNGYNIAENCPISRSQKQEVLAYVGKKYGLKRPYNVVIIEHTARMIAPRQ